MNKYIWEALGPGENNWVDRTTRDVKDIPNEK